MCRRVPKNESPRASRRRAGQPKPSGRTRRVVHWLVLFVGSLIIVDGFVGERGLLAMLRARRDYDVMSAAIARQRADNGRLRDEVRRLTDDPAAIEEIARRDLGLIRPGERVFIIKDVLPAKP